jgi:23S rRNA pseudouridine2605 synthase
MKAHGLGRVPLERALSKLGLCSRIEAAAKIAQGQVKVHGVVELNPRRMVNPNTAHIEIAGVKAEPLVTKVVLFHKPKGVVTTKRDPEGRKTLYDFLPSEYQSFHAVGRLDMHTSGLLILTNDTQFSNFLTNPENRILRVYIVQVRGEVTSSTLSQMLTGVIDQEQTLKAEAVILLKSSGRESSLEMTLTEGKYREIRRLCLALGHEVLQLKRIRYGKYELGDLAPGQISLQ